jgi:hypothetical protein
VAALRCERREFALRDDAGTTMALLRDDKVTVRRNGLTIARYREVMLTPVGPGLSGEQAGWLEECLTAAGATAVSRFPRLVHRLGAPATGQTDFPEPQPLDPDAEFNRFVSQLLADRLRRVLVGDLRVRGGDSGAIGALRAVLVATRAELAALTPVLVADWAEDLHDELDWAAEALVGTDNGGGPLPLEQAVGRLRSERYLILLDRLVGAVRAPRVGVHGAEPASQVLGALVSDVLAGIRRTADRLSVDAPARLWQEASAAAGRLVGVGQVAGLLEPVVDGRLAERLAGSRHLLDEIQAREAAAEQLRTAVEEMSPADAFDAGRQFERERDQIQVLRTEFVTGWVKVRKQLAR